MSFFRQIHTRMWGSDSWFAEMPAEEKLLFIYLFSNERASVSGLYELPLRLIAFETGLGADAIRQGLTHFTEAGKALYDFEKGVVWVRNMMKYQGTLSPKLIARIKADVSKVPDCEIKTRWLSEYTVLIGYEYGKEKVGEGMDTSILLSSPLGSVSVSEEGGGAGEETTSAAEWIPETVREASQHPYIQLYQEITNGFPGDGNYRSIVEVFGILKQRGLDLREYLPPFWQAWSTRKTSEGKPYKKNSPVWYAEWAMSGKIPSANGHEPQLGEKARQKTQRSDVIRKVAQRG